MQGQFKVKTKLSFSPGKTKDSIFMVKGRLGKKLPSHLFAQANDAQGQSKRPESLSAHKNKHSASKLFKKAHIIHETETYLPNDLKNRLTNTEASSPPHSLHSDPTKAPLGLTSSGKTLGRAKSGEKETKKKDIQRTVSITYKGKAKEVPMKPEMLKTLSKMIPMDDKEAQDQFQLEILGESSIHGNEQNFIDLGDSDFFGEAIAEGLAFI